MILAARPSCPFIGTISRLGPCGPFCGKPASAGPSSSTYFERRTGFGHASSLSRAFAEPGDGIGNLQPRPHGPSGAVLMRLPLSTG